MDLSRDNVRNFCKSRGLDGYGQDHSKPKPEKVIREYWKNCGKPINQKKRWKVVPKPIVLYNVKENGNIKIQSSSSMYANTMGSSLRTNQRVGITVAVDATFETGSGEMKILKMWSIIVRKGICYKMYQYGFRIWLLGKKLKNQMKIRRNTTKFNTHIETFRSKNGG